MRLNRVIAVMPKVGTKMAVSSGKKLNQELLEDANQDLIKLEAVAIRITRNLRQLFMFVASQMKPVSKIYYTLFRRLVPSGNGFQDVFVEQVMLMLNSCFSTKVVIQT